MWVLWVINSIQGRYINGLANYLPKCCLNILKPKLRVICSSTIRSYRALVCLV